MTKQLKIIIFAGAILILIGAIIAIFLLRPQNGSNLTIKDRANNNVKVSNFVNSAVLNYQDVPVIVSNDKFTIQYDTKNNVFQIYLNIIDPNDLMSYRVEAENELAKRLSIPLNELCSLFVTETVPDNGTVQLPVYNYAPSVCTK